MREDQIDTLVEKMAALSARERDANRNKETLKTQMEKTEQLLEASRREQHRLQLQVAELDKFSKEEREWHERQKTETTKRMQDEISRREFFRSLCLKLMPFLYWPVNGP